jgi:hypothetical protein
MNNMLQLVLVALKECTPIFHVFAGVYNHVILLYGAITGLLSFSGLHIILNDVTLIWLMLTLDSNLKKKSNGGL